GLTLSAGLFATALVHSPLAVPAALVSVTIRGASMGATSSALAAPVMALAEGMAPAVCATKLKLVAAVVMAVGIVGAGAWGYGGRGTRVTENTTEAAPEKSTASSALGPKAPGLLPGNHASDSADEEPNPPKRPQRAGDPTLPAGAI